MAVAEEFEEFHVAEFLKLLANFGLNVGVVRMELCEYVFAFVDFFEFEFRFVQGFYDVQNVESPAAFLNV